MDEMDVLQRYATGELSRSVAMQRLVGAALRPSADPPEPK